MKHLPRDMVAAWLRREDNVLKASGNPTWKSLIKALETVGQKGVAEYIRKVNK